MLRILGAGLVLLAAVGAAQGLKTALNLRISELKSWLLAVRLLQREIGYGMMPLPRVFNRIFGQVEGVAGEFLANVAENLAADLSLTEVWQQNLKVEGSGWHLLAEDYALLAELGAGIGQSDLAGQRRLLGMTEERLTALLSESEERYSRLARLVGGLGWCAGLMLVCLCL